MKKTFLFAAFAALCMTSCMNEEFPTLNPSTTGYGYISVNASNDPVIETRAVVNVENLATWTIETSKTGEETKEIWSSTAKYEAGTYTVYARNHKSDIHWQEANGNWGDAYYEGHVSVEVKAGETAKAEISCGKAKNARLKVEFNLISNFTEYSLTAERNLVFDSSNEETALAYYAATEEVDYTFNYTYNSTPKEITGKITMKGAATENIISIASNDNGTISVTVNYNDTFETGNSETLVFDAATGEQVDNSTSGEGTTETE